MAGEDIAELINNLKRLSALSQAAVPLRSAGASQTESDQSPAQAERLLEILKSTAGLRSNTALRRRLQRRFESIPENELEHWLERITAQPDHPELQGVIEDLTNHESYFFRDDLQLEALFGSWMTARINEKASIGNRQINLWSSACASGEEAYTLAMLAVEALDRAEQIHISPDGSEVDWRGWTITVQGTDISRQAVARARQACYRLGGLGSLRQVPDRYWRFFRPCDGGGRHAEEFRQPVSWLRDRVSFSTFNLMSKHAPFHQMDAVLCRNVLIYIEPALHAKVQTMLTRSLVTGGMLVMSPVDTNAVPAFLAEHWHRKCVMYERRKP